jgi:adenine-specific DNA-methyltransferase
MPTLSWIGKEKVVNHHLEVPYRVLEHRYGYRAGNAEDKSFTGSGNMIIHGDNLEALKALLPEYEGKVKCIYIDPPYNTGNEGWVYNDNVNHPKIQKWLGEVVGKQEEDFTRHDKWLCMMYPRLRLLQRLLSEDGAIYISIDDNEQANLKLICDEIFGKKNFVESFVWYIDGHTDNQDVITKVHEYILCYAKEITTLKINDVVDPNTPPDSKILNSFAENSITKNGYKNPPSIIELPIGFPCEVETLNKSKHDAVMQLMDDVASVGFITREMTKRYKISYPARMDDMSVKDYVLEKPCRVYSGWMNNGKLKKFIENGCKPINDGGATLKFFLSKNGVLYYRKDGRSNHYIQTVLEKIGTTETNKYMLEGMGVAFDYPKPVSLIEYLVSMVANPNSIVIDSFAGSGTTAHAVLNLNKKDEGNRRFILVEMEDYAEEKTAKRIQEVLNGYADTEGTGGCFDFYELGDTLFNADGTLNDSVSEDRIREYIYYTETKQHLSRKREVANRYLLDIWNGMAYYFYYEKGKETTLTYDKLSIIKEKAERYIVYADTCTLDKDYMNEKNIIFKKIPRDIQKF